MRLRKYCCGLSLGRLSATRVGSPTTLAALVFLLTVPASVSSQTPFYQAKTITLVQGTAPGGSSDMMVKAALPYLKKYIPGEPGIVSDYMPGGGGVKAVNHLYKNVRPDGLTIANVGGGLVSNAVLGEPSAAQPLPLGFHVETGSRSGES